MGAGSGMLFHQLKRDRRSALIPALIYPFGHLPPPTFPWRNYLGVNASTLLRTRRSANPEPLLPLLVGPVGVLTGLTLGAGSSVATVKIAQEILGNFEKKSLKLLKLNSDKFVLYLQVAKKDL